MNTLRPTTYTIAAVAISVAWHPLLQLAPPMRRFLGAPSVLEVSPFTQLVLFVATGLAVALLFRSTITGQDAAAPVGATLLAPFVASELFAIGLVCWKAAAGTSGGGDLPAAVIGAPLVTLSAFYVVVPLAFASTYLLRKSAGLNRQAVPQER